MKQSKSVLAIFLVLLVIIGFAAVAIYSYYLTLTTDDQLPPISDPLIWAANALAGLVGGIVASAFGVELPKPLITQESRYKFKTKVMGNLITDGKLAADVPSSDNKTVLGQIYAWVYIIIGVAAFVVWISDDFPHAIIINLATVSFGLILVIVKNFFN
jgi:hypothetical protein